VAVEVERLVADQSRRVIETLVHRLVPELAESLLKQEIARLVREGEEAALAATEPKPAEDSGLRRP
jgi:ATP-dependent helicase YprA (DUF1998 family)